MIIEFIKRWRKRKNYAYFRRHCRTKDRKIRREMFEEIMKIKPKDLPKEEEKKNNIPFYLDPSCSSLNYYVKRKHFDGFYYECPFSKAIHLFRYIAYEHECATKSKFKKKYYKVIQKGCDKLYSKIMDYYLDKNDLMSAIEIPKIRKMGIKYEEAPRKRANKLKRFWYKITLTAYCDDYHKEQTMQD